ncbi:MAG: HDIG domain-containing metalloprotein [Thermoplasmatota archaeon]
MTRDRREVDDDVPFPHIEVLRLGHRPERDKRITTHVALVSRAFGAKGIYVDRKDSKLEETIGRVNGEFGSDFFIRTGTGKKGPLGRWGGTIVHLTMYGMALSEAVRRIPRDEKILVVVGAEKVPREVYDLAHFNVSVTNQPHSEVSALAILLDRLAEGRELELEFSGGVQKIIPDSRGKTVLSGERKRDATIKEQTEADRDPVPTPEKCIELLRSMGCSELVITHVKAVRDLGMEMIETAKREHPDRNLDVDEELLEAGLLLHDLGRSATHSIRHITHGARMARELGLDERIVSMVHNHIGAGVTAEEAAALGLEMEDHIPLTLMERIVCHADNLVGERRRRPLSAAVEKLRRKGAFEGAERMERLHAILEDELGIDIDMLVAG